MTTDPTTLKGLRNELYLLWLQLDAYNELYVVEQEKRGKLLQLAPGLFNTIRFSFIESIFLRIGRLMDRGNKDQDSHKNISIAHIISDKKWKQLKTEYEEITTIRNKYLAHNDWKKRNTHSSEQIWYPITLEHCNKVQALACKLWQAYKHVYPSLEPKHAELDERPVMLLKALSDSYLVENLIAEGSTNAERRISSYDEYIGQDELRTIFE